MSPTPADGRRPPDDWHRWRRERRAWWEAGGPPKERPEWWPDGEPWPPRRMGPPWARRRGPFMGGFGCLFGLVFVVGAVGLLVAVTSVVVAAGPLGDVARILGLIVLLLGLAGIMSAGRRFRRSAASLDDLLEATERVEAGDYSARVRVPGRAPRPVRDLVEGFNAMAGRLEASEMQRRTLLADVSHELRTPLAVVQGNVEAILDGVHPADAEHLGAILEETRVLGRLVDDVRTLALSDAGRLPLHAEPTDLDVLVSEAASAFGAAAATAGVTLTVEVPDDLPILDLDPVRIREVVSNLVANALRHTPSGGSVTLTGAVAGEDADRRVEIAVRDTGGGIDPALLPNVFDRFAKSADSRGSGLGLAIARGLVEAHGGRISVESQPGAGATFRFTLPVGSPDGTSSA
ncbi:MAG TPA: HAMP domain-containing sensor histidine kinase [Candidatus Limnocylindrales bacterium]|nr:HAMP domain-containing sensor histidine kinase [Candidatus Limnocylindrales bacterium]